MAYIKVIEQSTNKLILRSQDAIYWAVTISIFLLLSGIFWCLLSLLLVKNKPTFVIFLSIVSECIFFAIALYSISKLFEVTTCTFDRSASCLYLQKYSQLRISKKRTIEIPFELIYGIKIEAAIESAADSEMGYYIKLILKSIYWFIYFKTNGQYQNAIDIATAVANFLKIPYFSERSPAPSPALPQQILEKVDPELFSWRYLQEAEIDRLRQHLNLYPDDAEAHLNLGFLLYYIDRFFNQKKAIVSLQQAEDLFESQQNSDRATIAKVLKTYISWN